MKEFEPPRFLASGRWIEDEKSTARPSLLSMFSQRRERAERARKLWAESMALHDEVFARWSEYELDLGKLIDYPAMSDLREPRTVAMVQAMRHAQRLRPAGADGGSATGGGSGSATGGGSGGATGGGGLGSATGGGGLGSGRGGDLGSEAAAAEYRSAVRAFEQAFLVAEAEAKRIKRGHYSAAEQQRLRTARQLLNIAVDDGSSPSERQGAYLQLRKTVDGLLHLPERALAALENPRNGGFDGSGAGADSDSSSGSGADSGSGKDSDSEDS